MGRFFIHTYTHKYIFNALISRFFLFNVCLKLYLFDRMILYIDFFLNNETMFCELMELVLNAVN